MAEEIGSEKWIEENNSKLAQINGGSELDGISLKIGIELRSESDTISYSLAIDNGVAELAPGKADSDVILTIDPAVAKEINSGTKQVADAIAEGYVKIRGNVKLLIASEEVLSNLAEALSAVIE